MNQERFEYIEREYQEYLIWEHRQIPEAAEPWSHVALLLEEVNYLRDRLDLKPKVEAAAEEYARHNPPPVQYKAMRRILSDLRLLDSHQRIWVLESACSATGSWLTEEQQKDRIAKVLMLLGESADTEFLCEPTSGGGDDCPDREEKPEPVLSPKEIGWESPLATSFLETVASLQD